MSYVLMAELQQALNNVSVFFFYFYVTNMLELTKQIINFF
jgi:hypothetical protein